MRPAVLFLVAAVAILGAGCGAEIGDSCLIYTDCAQDGTRICDTQSSGGYCTIQGCDYNTCPGEATCVRFFTNSFANKTCNAATEDTPGGTDDCNPDELCALDGHCVTRASEVRYCMRKCGSGGDCRSGYECRDESLMVKDGGEPVPATDRRLCGPGEMPGPNNVCDVPQAFCAQAPSTSTGPDAGS